MLNKKTIGVALACALAFGAFSGTTFASPVNIGGVVVDSESPLDLSIQALQFRESSVGAVGDFLTGYGKIGAVNDDSDQASFCPGCNLTFTFKYRVADIDTTSGTNPLVVFDSGVLNFYVDNTSSFNVLNPNTAGIGSLWLSLAGHTAPRSGFDFLGQLYSSVNGTPANPTGGSFGFGLLDVTGGAAASFADTNTVKDGIGGLADFSLNSSFQTQDAGICAEGICYPVAGQGGLIGSSAVAVPEPGAAGLLGVGLAALGLFMRRRRNEAAGRV